MGPLWGPPRRGGGGLQRLALRAANQPLGHQPGLGWAWALGFGWLLLGFRLDFGWISASA